MHESSQNQVSQLLKSIRSWNLLWNIPSLLAEITNTSIEILEAEKSILIIQEKDGLVVKSSRNKSQTEKADTYSKTVASKVMQNGIAAFVINTENDKDERQICCFPLSTGQGIIGVIYLEFEVNHVTFSNEFKDFVDLFAMHAASTLENALLYHSAITDPLTGLFSHTYFQQEVEQAIRRAIRTKTPLTLLMIDLDKFKLLNDSFGHEEGNKCLMRISQILKESFRESDIVARFGGDEFEVLLPDTKSVDAKKLSDVLIEKIVQENFPLKISATIGIATYPEHGANAQELFLASDKALYVGKENGRKQSVISKYTERLDKTKENSKEMAFFNIAKVKQAFPEYELKQTIDGQEIIEKIATSTNGEVLLVRQPDLDRLVALKRPLSVQLSEDQVKAFKNEAIITASLSHPGVVPLYTMGVGVDGRVYYTMKRLEGKSLKDILKANENIINKSYSHAEMLGHFLRICETIHFAHNKHVAHLDLHPGNVIVGEFGEITIVDWGRANRFEEICQVTLGESGFISGSPYYLSPEQIDNGRGLVGAHSDIYSLGVILFQILSGKLPFKKDSIKETIFSILNEPVQSPNKNNDNEVDLVLSELCLACLRKKSQERISIEEMINILKSYIFNDDEYVNVYFKDEQPLKADDWVLVTKNTGWVIKNDCLISNGQGEAIIAWRPNINGNYSIEFDGWIEKSGSEISISSHMNSIEELSRDSSSKALNYGYCFQFGGNNSQYTKLARHGEDVYILNSILPEIGKVYKIRIYYEKDYLSCFINGKRVFHHKELFPFFGTQIGFYSYGEGSFIKPVEIHYQKTGLKTDSIKLADMLYSQKNYSMALSRYSDIYRNFTGRFISDEAKLKMAMSYGKLGNREKANSILDEFKGNKYEPYALVLKATLEFPVTLGEYFNRVTDYRLIYKLMDEVVREHPQSQAKIIILEYVHDINSIYLVCDRNCCISFEDQLLEKARCLKFLIKNLVYTNNKLMYFVSGLILIYYKLGLWKELKTIFDEYPLSTVYKKLDYLDYRNHFIHYLFSSGQNEHLHSLGLVEKAKYPGNLDPLMWRLVFDDSQIYKLYFLDENIKIRKSVDLRVLSFLLMYSRIDFSIEVLNRNELDFNNNPFPWYREEAFWIEQVIGSQNNVLVEALQSRLERNFDLNHGISECYKILLIYSKMLVSLFEFNIENAAKIFNEIKEVESPQKHYEEKRVLFISFFKGLGFYNELKAEKVIEESARHQLGVRRELSLKLLEGKPFEFSDKWEKVPLNNFFDLFVYSLWLYLLGENKECLKIISKVNKPELNLAYYQPVIQKILAKINSKMLS